MKTHLKREYILLCWVLIMVQIVVAIFLFIQWRDAKDTIQGLKDVCHLTGNEGYIIDNDSTIIRVDTPDT